MKNLLLLNLCLLLACFVLFQESSPRKGKIKPQISLEERYSDLYKKIAHKIKDKYVEERELEEILKNGLYGLTKGLDPYSKILTKEKRDYYKNMKKGSYGGVGLHLSKIGKDLTILHVLPNSPASQTQLRAGDKIISIEKESTEDLSIKECSSRLKGEKNTTVKITVERPSEGKKFLVKITRGDIPLQNIAFSDFIEDSVFYIKVNKFTRDIDQSFSQALKRAKKEGLKSLILDFRGNSGGLLTSSLRLLDQILPQNKKILGLRGKNEKTLEEKKTRSYLHLKDSIKIFVLIDTRSASASEIVSGALQDLDRAIVIGSQSFGKGLVQKIYKIDETTSIKLTTARYYTPSGRLIQKKEYYKEEEKVKDSYKTLSGRPVLAKGGITPDFEIKEEELPPFIQALNRKNLFLFFAARYKNLHKLKFPIQLEEKILNDFEKYVRTHEVDYHPIGELSFNKLKDDLEEAHVDAPQEALQTLEAYYQKLKENRFKNKENKKWFKRKLLEKFNYALRGISEEIHQKVHYDQGIQKALELSRNSKLYQSVLSGK